MGRLGGGLLLALLLLGSVLASSGAPGESASAQTPLTISAPGGPYMRDQFGRRLEFHGFNLVAKCPSFSKAAPAPGAPCIPGPLVNQPSYWLSPDPAYLSVDPDRVLTDQDAANLAGLGFNIARVGVIWRGLEPGPANAIANDPTYCADHAAGTPYSAPSPFDAGAAAAYLGHIDQEVQLLARHGIYSLIDMHQDIWNEYFNHPTAGAPFEGEGAPLWATCTSAGGVTQQNSAGSNSTWNANYVNNPAMATAFDHFWNNDVSGNLQGEYIQAWTAVARHYMANPWVIGYDPFNEPYDSFYTATPVFDRKLQCFYAGQSLAAESCALTVPPSQAPPLGLVPAIQAVDSRHLIFFEAPVLTDFGAPETIGGPAFGALPFGGLVVNFHDYGFAGSAVSGFTSPGTGECSTPDCGPQETLTMTQFETARAATQTNQPDGPAWFMSEFGGEDGGTDIARVAGLADSTPVNHQPLSWTYWAALQNHDPTGGSMERLYTARRQLVQPKGCILARAYAPAVAGDPSAQSFDPVSGVFKLTYTPDPAIKAPTEIFVPPIHSGGSYRVQVTGATPTSPPSSTNLTLSNNPGATSVSVEVDPTGSSQCPALVAAALTPVTGSRPASPSSTAPLPATATGANMLWALFGMGLLLASLSLAWASAHGPDRVPPRAP